MNSRDAGYSGLQSTPKLVARLGLAAMTLSLEAFLKSIADELAAGDRQMAVRFSASLKTGLETTNLAERSLASA